MARPPPLGFFSYATVNDVHANGRLSELREVLEAEVRDHGVSDFHLFQDKSDIRGGDDWKQLIQEKLYASTVLIPLVTPTFFERPWCRWEVETFLQRRELAVDRLIAYPLYLIHDDDWEDDEWRDDFRASLHRFQARDLRSYRHAGFYTGAGRARVAELGKELAQKLKAIARREIVVGRGLELLRQRRWEETARELRRGKLEEEARLCERLAAELNAGRPEQAAALLSEAPPGWMDEGWRWMREWLEEERKAKGERAKREEEARKAAEAARKAEEARLAAVARLQESARSSAPFKALQVDRTGAAWQKRKKILDQLATTSPDPVQALAILKEYQTTTRNGADLWFIREKLGKIAAGNWPGATSTELRSQAHKQAADIFSHLPSADRERATRMIRWVQVPKTGGAPEYTAGSPPTEADRVDNEEQHRVRFTSGFFVTDAPVTNALYECFDPTHSADRHSFGGLLPEKDQDYVPAYNLTWYEAQMFAEWIAADGGSVGSRLPVEAEWEYFCRAGSNSAYHTGTTVGDLDRAGWYGGNSGEHPHPVRQKEPNAWGLYDCHGNVWEWCLDEFRAYPKELLILDPGDLRSCPILSWDNVGNIIDSADAGRVVRGGSWYGYAKWARSAFRNSRLPGNRGGGLGFRLVRPLPRA